MYVYMSSIQVLYICYTVHPHETWSLLWSFGFMNSFFLMPVMVYMISRLTRWSLFLTSLSHFMFIFTPIWMSSFPFFNSFFTMLLSFPFNRCIIILIFPFLFGRCSKNKRMPVVSPITKVINSTHSSAGTHTSCSVSLDLLIAAFCLGLSEEIEVVRLWEWCNTSLSALLPDKASCCKNE